MSIRVKNKNLIPVPRVPRFPVFRVLALPSTKVSRFSSTCATGVKNKNLIPVPRVPIKVSRFSSTCATGRFPNRVVVEQSLAVEGEPLSPLSIRQQFSVAEQSLAVSNTVPRVI